jgi:hypothetical protein
MPMPIRPAPPMPECKPARVDDWRDRAEVLELLDTIERLSDRVEALESMDKQISAATDGQKG